MLKINIILLGKLKERYLQDAEQEYLKRLSPSFDIKIHELREESFTDNSVPDQVKAKEAEKILNVLEKLRNPFIFIMDEKGKEFSSVQFAEKISSIDRELVFIIGGPMGLSEEIKKIQGEMIALSKMTFTHQMVRIFLLEQIYRAMMINQNKKYHY